MPNKTCGSCVNCKKYTLDNGENWSGDPADKDKLKGVNDGN